MTNHTEERATAMSDTVIVVLKRETAQDLYDCSPEHTPGQVFHSLTPSQLDLKYALERALVRDGGGETWPPVLLGRERPGSILGFLGGKPRHGMEAARYIPASSQPEDHSKNKGETHG
jgi:hypothetical protein